MVPASIVLALSLLLPGAAPREDGEVLQVTAARAYLDAGSEDGLATGAEVTFRRGGAEIGRCRLEAVSARSAACPVAGVRSGDRFALPAAPVREEPRLLPAPAPAETLRARQAAIAAAPVTLVPYAPPLRRAGPSSRAATAVELSEVAWVATTAGAFTATRAGLSVRSAEVAMGMRLDLEAQAIRWTSRPDPRFRPGEASQLDVWQASLSRRDGPGDVAFAVGRVLPWRIPGATVLDGATAGWRREAWELGAFAGFAPEPVTLGLAGDRATGGGYWSWGRPFGGAISLRDEGRIAVVRSPELGTRLEAETRAAARLGRRLDLSGSVRLGFGGDVQAPGALDAARVELTGRPVRHLRLSAWGAYDGLDVPDDVEPAIFPGRSRRLEGSVAWEARFLRVTALAGGVQDLESGLDRGWVGPVIELPGLFPRRGGLSLGYLEELGWSDGRSAWLQAIVRPWERLRLLGRLSWSHASALAVTQDEVAATLGVAAELTRAFSARLTVSGRSALPTGEGGTVEGGGSVLATVVARY